MARIRIPDSGQEIEGDAIAPFLQQFGIWYERWDLSHIADIPNPTAEQVLGAFKPEIDRLKEKGGYVTADVIDVSADTPNLTAMLDRFNKEHTHSEDEVRFITRGRGVFFIHPTTGPLFSLEIEAGDLINVPAGTQHWFDLCAERRIQAIRLFLDKSGWTPAYIGEGVHAAYEPLCWGPAYIPRNDVAEVVKPLI